MKARQSALPWILAVSILAANAASADGYSLDDLIDEVADGSMAEDVLAHCPFPSGYEGGLRAYRTGIFRDFATLRLVKGDRTKAIDLTERFPSSNPADRCREQRFLALMRGAALGTPAEAAQTPLGLQGMPVDNPASAPAAAKAQAKAKAEERYWIVVDVKTPDLICETYYCHRPGVTMRVTADTTPVTMLAGGQITQGSFGVGQPYAAGTMVVAEITQQPADDTYDCQMSKGSGTVPAVDAAINANAPVHDVLEVTCTANDLARSQAETARLDKEASDARLQNQGG